MSFLGFIIILSAIGISIFILSISIYIFFIGFLTSKRNKKAFIITLSIFMFLSKLVVSNFSLEIRMMFFIIPLLIIVFIFFYGSPIRLLYHVILYTFIMMTSEMVYSIIAYQYGTNIETQYILSFVIYSLFSCIPLIAVLAIVKFLSFFNTDSAIGLANNEYILLGIPPALSLIYLLRIVNINDTRKAFVCIFLIIINACIVLTYNNISRKNYLIQQYTYKREQNKYIEEYINRQHDIVRLKHDLKNILFNVDMYLQAEKINEARDQIKELIDTTAFSDDIRSGCIPIDAVLNHKLYLIKQNNIKNSMNLQIPMELDTSHISLDFAAILGNLLDNAIEASQRNQRKDSNEIIVDIKYSENKLYIYVSNISDEPNQDFTKKIVRSKKGINRYGVGINSIKERVDKLKGYYDFKYESGYFKTLIILPLSTSVES